MSKKPSKPSPSTRKRRTVRPAAGAPVQVSFKRFNAALADLQSQLAGAARRRPDARAIAALRTYLDRVAAKTRCERGMTSTF